MSTLFMPRTECVGLIQSKTPLALSVTLEAWWDKKDPCAINLKFSPLQVSGSTKQAKDYVLDREVLWRGLLGAPHHRGDVQLKRTGSYFCFGLANCPVEDMATIVTLIAKPLVNFMNKTFESIARNEETYDLEHLDEEWIEYLGNKEAS